MTESTSAERWGPIIHPQAIHDPLGGHRHDIEPTDVNRLIGLGDDGLPFEFAVHTLNDSELGGACFANNAKDVLFVNTFGDGSPGSGATFAITGPWSKGAL